MATGSEFPPAAELAGLRDLFADHLVHGNTVKVLTATVDGTDAEGRSVLAYPDAGDVDAVPARIERVSARELRGDLWVQVQEWRVRLPAGTTVGHGDRIVDADTGDVFEVATVTDHGSHLGVIYRLCGLVRIDGSVL
jgi:hypothetical protein